MESSMGPDSGTWLRIGIVTVATVVALALIVAAARRSRSYWWVPIALIAASYAGIALACCFAVRMFIAVFADLSTQGGGIASLSFGFWQAMSVPLAAAWVALLTTVTASIFLLPVMQRGQSSADGQTPGRAVVFALIALLALVAGAAPVLLFLRDTAYILYVVTPQPHPVATGMGAVSQTVATHLNIAIAVSLGCFLFVTGLALSALRRGRRSAPSRALLLLSAVMLVVSLAASAALIAKLQAAARHFRSIAITGRADEP
ncbi:MAG: hypothetical protein JWN02_1718 [Acidobacteria bacterium]|nr:hypothetical protein [Acidobacteriota bacterium]